MAVELDAKDFICKHCNRTLTDDSTKDWVIELTNRKMSAAICPDCFTIHGAPAGSIQLEELNGPSFEHEAPIEGAFKPVKSTEETKRLRDCGQLGEAWYELEFDLFEVLAKGYPLLKVNLSVHEIPDLWIKLEWSGSTLVSIEASGDLPRRNYLLTIYQKARLAAMGLVEQGTTNKVWSFTPTNVETTKENIPRIISHILQFGLLVESNRIYAMTPILDTKAPKLSI